MKLSIMIEGQNGLNWDNWKKIVDIAEDNGFYGLYRSDHFTNMNPPDRDSLELWTSLTYLATVTKRIKFGSLISPVSFRHPVMTTRMATAVDDLSGGRLKLGLGAGWQTREHETFGFDLLPFKPRFKRFDEALYIINHLMKQEEPLSFSGEYYQIKDAVVMPHPLRVGGPEILIGGNGEKLTFPLVIKYANEWNAIFLTPEQVKDKNLILDDKLLLAGKDPKSIRRSLMTNLTYAENSKKLDRKINGRNIHEMKSRGIIVGIADDLIDQLQHYQKTGIDEIMLQWLDLEDVDGLVDFSKKILPEFQ